MGSGKRWRIGLAGTPTAMAKSATSLVTTAFEPMMAPVPMLTPA